MKHIYCTLLACLISISSFCQKDASIQELITDFEQSILTKDSVRFKKLFLDAQVPFVGIMSQATEASIKKDYPDFEGTAVSNCTKFIQDICKSTKKQEEKFYNIKIHTDGAVGAVAFDYAYFSGMRMMQWGHEKWNLVKIKDEWLITNVVYSIHFPDIEPFPFEAED